MLFGDIATTAHRARVQQLVPRLEQVASADVPMLFGRRRALAAAREELAPALAQAREAQRLLGEVPQLRRIAERMDTAVVAAEARAASDDPRKIARELATGLRRIDAELSPAAARVDELFARDAATWTRAEIEELRAIFLEAPEQARPPVFGGPHPFRNDRFDMRQTIDYLQSTHDSTDLAMADRYAASWRLMRDPSVTKETLAQRVDELFARDAATWTTREIHDLRAIWHDAPDDLRPHEVGGPYTVKNQAFTIQSVLDWMTTTHDSTDIAVSNRFAAAWRAAGMDATPEAVAARVDDIFRRDANTWTSAEIAELRTLLYDVPERLRPGHGPERLAQSVNFRLAAGPKEEAGVRYSLREVLDYMAATHDATDLQMSNMYAEAWLLASRHAKDEVLERLRRHAATGEAIAGPGGRTPTEVTISILRDEFLDAAATGSERALRAASLLTFANTRRETSALLRTVREQLPTQSRAELQPAIAEARRLVDNNLQRINGSVPSGEARGMLIHARYDELGRIQSLVRLVHHAESMPTAPRASTTPAPAAPVAGATVSW